ncbi:MAG TPA: hypothetical protein VHT28_02290 [Silvibacterium sp.]|nr:hypothetical protein [Silvibacterium sp.]
MFLSIYQIKKRSIADAAVNVYLPAFLLIPSIYGFRIPHLPGMILSIAALIPIVVTLLARHWREWKFQRTDLWMALFFAGLYYTELSHSGAANAGLISIGGLETGIMPYILGKLLLEQDGVRERFARRYAYICFFVAIISVWEFRMGNDLFVRVEGLLLGFGYVGGQIRNGFMRIAGPFTGSIQAGSVFALAWLFSMWLGVVDKSRGNEPKYLGLRRSTILSIGSAGGLIMSLSRGPMVGAILSLMVARIGKAKNMARTAVITIVLITVGGTFGYFEAQQYTSGTIETAKSQDQGNAIYRRMLLDQYKPYVEKGGLFGYGVIQRPVVPGMFSIDNAYLNIQLIQGNLGLWMFILLGGEAVIAGSLAARRSTEQSDVFFALCIVGGMAGFLLALTTVWLGSPMYELFFLMVGWSQSLRQTESVGVMLPQPVSARFSFRRVIA